MTERIEQLTKLVLDGKMWFETTDTEYDREDLFLDPVEMSAKRVSEYILNQEPVILEHSALTGYLRFDGSVEGDFFGRAGHKSFNELMDHFYNKPLNNICTFEWQHSCGDFAEVVNIGIEGVLGKIHASMAVHSGKEEQIFLKGLETVCGAILGWAEKCSLRAAQKAETVKNTEYKRNLELLSAGLKNVPRKPAGSFYEAVLSTFLCYSFVPDSVGNIDRYFYPLYRKDIDSGVITREQAGEYLQELFLMLQGRIHRDSDRFYRGGESHFAIGGYWENGEDGFNDLSRLIVESLMDLPTFIPQISLRWTKKTPQDVLYYMMDCERKDPNKRIAFVNDEPRIESLMNIVGFTYEQAVNYTMVGCNELAFPGGVYMGGCKENFLLPIEGVFHRRSREICEARDFEAFYSIFEDELFKNLQCMMEYNDKFNLARARDVNLVSAIFFKGCVENAKSLTQGGATIATCGMGPMGIVNVMDSLAITKQFVYDEKIVTMEELVEALQKNWEGYEELRNMILKKGKFFGNDDETSNEAAARFCNSLYEYLKDKKNVFGYKYLVGNLTGYNQHYKWFGERTAATPDGRRAGDAEKFGLGQSEGYDREGLTALLNSVAKCDKNGILRGPTVTNVLLDEQLVTNDENFEKLVKIFETYLKNGGLHFQLSYVSKDDLKGAKETPDKYKSLRVRVSGFSDYFVLLNEDLQDEIITRTTQVG